MFKSVTTRGNRHADRLIVLAGLGILVTISLMYLFYIANDTSGMNMPMGPDMQDSKGMSAMKPSVPMAWSLSEWFAMFTMWSVMMIGMMIPSASPMILVFSKVNRQKKLAEVLTQGQAFLLPATLSSGPLSQYWPPWSTSFCTRTHSFLA